MQAGATSKPRQIGLVGLGKIATDQHLPAIAASAGFELAAIATLGPCADHGVPVFADHRAMLAALPDLSAVAICTPPAARYAVARDALLAGRHVLLEKPTAATLAEAEALVQLAAAAGRVVFATWHSRFNPAVARAKQMLAGQRIAAMDVQWREDVEKWHPGQDWIWRPGGFGVFDPGINALSIMTEILPGPLFVRGCRLLLRPGEQTPVAAALRLGSDHTDAMAAVFDWRPGPDIRRIEVTTEGGTTLLLTQSGRRLEVDGVLSMTTGNDEYAAIYRHFAGLIDRGASDAELSPLRLVADAMLLGIPGPVD